MDIPTHKTSQELLEHVLRTSSFTSNTIERIFVDNCALYGQSFFNHVFFTLQGSTRNKKEKLIETLDENGEISMVYKLLDTYLLEFFVRNTSLNTSNAVKDLIQYSSIIKSTHLVEYIYSISETTVDSDTFLARILDALLTDSLTSFEFSVRLSNLCSWEKFRSYLTTHPSWCYSTIQQNQSSILSKFYSVNYTRKTFVKISRVLQDVTKTLYKENRSSFFKWISTMMDQNHQRMTDNWIMGIRTFQSNLSSSNTMLLNVFCSIFVLSKKNCDSLEDVRYNNFIECLTNIEYPLQIDPKTCLFYIRSTLFDVVIYPLFKKFEYVSKEYRELENTIENATVEYTNNNGCILSIATSLGNMFKSKLQYLSKSVDVKNLLIPQICDIIIEHGQDFMKWIFENKKIVDENLGNSDLNIITMLTNVLFVLNSLKEKFNCFTFPKDDSATLFDVCIFVITNPQIHSHEKTEAVRFLNLHIKDNHFPNPLFLQLLSYYGQIGKKKRTENSRVQETFLSKIISIMADKYSKICKINFLPSSKEQSTVFMMLNNLSEKFESFRENYEYARETYDDSLPLSVQQIISQHQYFQLAGDRYVESTTILENLHKCIIFEDFKTVLISPIIVDKLSELILYIVRYAEKRFIRSFEILSEVFTLVTRMITFPEFAERFIGVCGSTKPEEFIRIQDNICLKSEIYSTFDEEINTQLSKNILPTDAQTSRVTFQLMKKMFKIHKEIDSQITNILNTLMLYKSTPIDYDNVPERFLDPLMHSIIEEPLVLPHSNIVMDRVVICRYLEDREENPFTRENLTIQDLNVYNETEEAQTIIQKFTEEWKEWEETYSNSQNKNLEEGNKEESKVEESKVEESKEDESKPESKVEESKQESKEDESKPESKVEESKQESKEDESKPESKVEERKEDESKQEDSMDDTTDDTTDDDDI